MDCPRCGEPVAIYTLGEERTVQCAACGYVGVPVDLSAERTDSEAWVEALERFREHQHTEE